MDGPIGTDDLPPEWQVRVQSELGDRERLVWVQQPNVGRYVKNSAQIVLFGIPFTGFAIFWIASAWVMMHGFPGNGQKPSGPGFPFDLFPFFGIPFVFVGLGMLSAPLWYWRCAKRSCYAITSLRAIVWQAGLFGGVSVRSYGAEALGKVFRKEYPDGTGDLILEQYVEEGTDSDGQRTTRTIRHGFIAIDEVRQIEVLLLKTLALKRL